MHGSTSGTRYKVLVQFRTVPFIFKVSAPTIQHNFGGRTMLRRRGTRYSYRGLEGEPSRSSVGINVRSPTPTVMAEAIRSRLRTSASASGCGESPFPSAGPPAASDHHSVADR